MKQVLFISTNKRDILNLYYQANLRWNVSAVRDAAVIPSLLASRHFDFILFDFTLSGANASELLSRIMAIRRHPPIFALSRESCGAFRKFACRFGLMGDFCLSGDTKATIDQIERCAEDLPGERALSPIDSCSDDQEILDALGGLLIGGSPLIARLRQTILSLVSRRDPILITGETGTGKDLVARLIHRHSPVSAGPCVVRNVSCIAEGLAESELFGSVRGAFTDAQDRGGMFEEAAGGTLFLDEIGELSLGLQPKFLRVLEDGIVCRVGAQQGKGVDFRLICATNRSLHKAVDDGLFRRDLYHRIDVIRLELPPLRAHPEDIALLASVRLQPAGKYLAPNALDKLCSYHWPGNVRELFSCVSRAASLSPAEIIRPDQILF